jgi:23S rRNA (uracil1939-C5)-methyltransferase
MARRRRVRLPKEPVELSIEDLSHDGRGVARLEGKTVFVSMALPGETVSAEYVNRRRSFDETIALEILKKSPDRVDAECPHYAICGGCSLQHMDWQKQISFKQGILKQQLHHFGGTEPENWLEPVQANPWGYRRKARLGVKNVPKKGGVLVGFREKKSHYIADIKSCHILHKDVDKLLLPLREMIGTLEAKARLPQIEVAVGDSRMALVFRNLDELCELDQQTIIDFGKNHDVDVYLQPKGPDTVHRIWPSEGEQRLHYALEEFGLMMSFHPMDFTQVNYEINRKITKMAIDFLQIEKHEKVLDLFCGLGNFSLPLATRAKSVVAVEGVEAMVERGYENANNNNLDNVDFFATDLFSDLSNADWAQQKFDKILIDPPRSGAQEICQQITNFSAKRIVYVSCNPATLARDSGILIEKGYKLVSAGVMDMFPHTGHVESIAVFDIK